MNERIFSLVKVPKTETFIQTSDDKLKVSGTFRPKSGPDYALS
jgi:hypothetical protein